MNPNDITRYWPIPEPGTVELLNGGLNNETYRVQTAAEAYILRVYRPTVNPEAVAFERNVIGQAARAGLPFALPVPIAARDGSLLVRTGDRLASLIPLIPGAPPDRKNPAHAAATGLALGQLVGALAGVDPVAKPASVCTYADFDRIHPANPDPLGAVQRMPVPPEQQTRMARWLEDLYGALPGAYATLPRQIIHGDYVYHNILYDGDRVSAVLDFEFTCHDLRGIDLASGLAGWTGTGLPDDTAWALIDAFGRAYASVQPLAPAEAEALPILLRLRRAAVYANLAGMYLAGTHGPDTAVYGVESVLQLEDWLQRHGAELVRRAKAW